MLRSLYLRRLILHPLPNHALLVTVHESVTGRRVLMLLRVQL